jgi:hypothetical protein
MLLRSLAVIAAALLTPSTLSAQAFEYAPSTGQYRVTSKTTGAQDIMGQTQQFETSNDELLTVTVARPHADTLALTVVVDSLDAVGPMGMPVPGADKMTGVTVSAKLSPFGALYWSIGPRDDSIPNGEQITSELSRLLPRIRAKLAQGTTWTDTTSGSVRQNGVDIDRRVIATYLVAGDTTIGGMKSWKMMRETLTTMSGSGAPNGQTMSVEGRATGKGIVLMSQSGVYLGSESEDRANVKIMLTPQAMDVSVTTTSQTKIEKVK